MKNISENKKPVRREFLFTASYTLGAVGVGAVVWPLIDQMNPDASVKAVSTTEVDIGNIELGKTITVLWRGKPKQVAWYYEGLYKEFSKHLKGHKVLKDNYLSVVKEIKKVSSK